MIDMPDEAAPEDIDDVYGQPSPDAEESSPLKTKFQPWHHPRKQFVRINQWCAETRKLLGELPLGPGTPFRYLTLPGDELLDIRALHGVFERAQIPLRYFGFNSVGHRSPAQQELNISLHEVRALSQIDQFSSIRQDRLETLAHELGPSFQEAERNGPFHAINLDLCNSITLRDHDDPGGSVLAALRRLLDLQFRSTTPWLLFITTLAQPEGLTNRNQIGFQSAISANVQASSDFRRELSALMGCREDEIDERMARTWQTQDTTFVRLYSTGLGKWLLSLLADAAPPRELILLSSYYYQVGPTGPDMISLAFRCNTQSQQINDRHGIIPASEGVEQNAEVTSAIQLARQVAQSLNLDETLARDEKIALRMIEKSQRLLQTARYSPEEYMAWARSLVPTAIPLGQ